MAIFRGGKSSGTRRTDWELRPLCLRGVAGVFLEDRRANYAHPLHPLGAIMPLCVIGAQYGAERDQPLGRICRNI